MLTGITENPRSKETRESTNPNSSFSPKHLWNPGNNDTRMMKTANLYQVNI